MAKIPGALADATKLRVLIDGVGVTTTARHIRRHSVSPCVADALAGFERARRNSPCSGRLARFDRHDGTGRTVDIQIDIVST